jgi:N-acetylmuramoyl-L-alanine amidase
MRIAIDCGHTLSGADYGAIGIRAESLLTREVGKRVIIKLKAMGYTVIDCTLDKCSNLGQSLGYRVNKANYNNVDLFVSIHFNCFNSSANGVEIYTYNANNFTEANRSLQNLVNLGFVNRGIKSGNNLYVIKHTKAKAMLVECCFCDSRKDMNIYAAEKCANAIVSGITGQSVVVEYKESKYPSIDTKQSDNKYVTWKSNNGLGYIESIPEKNRLIIHLDKYNYISIQDHAKEGNSIKLFTRTKGSKELI